MAGAPEQQQHLKSRSLVSNVSSVHKTSEPNFKCQLQFTSFKEISKFIWKIFFRFLRHDDNDNDWVQLQQHSRDNIKIRSEVDIWKNTVDLDVSVYKVALFWAHAAASFFVLKMNSSVSVLASWVKFYVICLLVSFLW